MHAKADPAYPSLAVVAAAALCFGLWLFSALSATGRVVVHWLSGPLLPGGSAGAASVFIAGVTCALLRLASSRPRDLTPRVRRTATASLVAAIVLGHALVLFDHLRWADLAGLMPIQHGCRGTGELFLCDDLLHSRAGAGLLDAVWSALVQGVVPPPLAMFLLGMLAIGVFAALALLPDVVRRFDGRWSLVWLVVFPTIHGLATLVDGGPLSVRLPLSLAVLVLVVGARDRADLVRRVRAGWIWPVAAVVVTVVIHGVWSDAGWGAALNGCAMLAVACAAPLALAWHPAKAARRRMRTAAAVLTLGSAGGVYVLETAHGAGALLQPLAAGYRFTVLDLERVAVVRTEPVPRGWNAIDVYRSQGEDPLAPRRVYLWRDTGEPRGTLSVSVVLPDGRTLRAQNRVPVQAPARILGAVPGSDSRREVIWVRGEDGAVPPFFPEPGAFLADHNAAVHLQLVAALLRFGGLSGFTLSPLPATEDAPDQEAILAPVRLASLQAP